MSCRPPRRVARAVILGAVALGLVLGLIYGGLVGMQLAGLIRPFHVPTNGMAPTIAKGDLIYMERLSLLRRDPKRGEVVVFHTAGLPIPDAGEDMIFFRRVTAIPGDELVWKEGALFLNGEKLPAVIPRQLGSWWPTPGEKFVVPTEQYFVLGDNSANSFDGRYWGCVRRANILGRVVLRYGPRERIGWVH